METSQITSDLRICFIKQTDLHWLWEKHELENQNTHSRSIQFDLESEDWFNTYITSKTTAGRSYMSALLNHIRLLAVCRTNYTVLTNKQSSDPKRKDLLPVVLNEIDTKTPAWQFIEKRSLVEKNDQKLETRMDEYIQ